MESNRTFDLSTLDSVAAANDGASLELKHPGTHAPLGIFIRLAGRDSDKFKEADFRARNQRLDLAQKGVKMNRTAEEIDAEVLDMLAACTLGWDGLVENGKEVEFSKAKAKHIYVKYPWIREQVDAFISDRSNFFIG